MLGVAGPTRTARQPTLPTVSRSTEHMFASTDSARALYWFDPSCEEQVAFGRPGFTPGRLPCLLTGDLETLPVFLCAADDLVLVRRQPSSSFLDELRRAGFSIPEFGEYSPAGLANLEIADRSPGRLCPWGWSPESAAFLAPLHRGSEPLWHDRFRHLYSKAWSASRLAAFLRAHPADWLCDRRAVGVACSSLEEIHSTLDELFVAGTEEALVKAAFGQSGRNQLRLSAGQLDEQQTAWLRRILSAQGCVVVEPRLDKCVDLSLHLDITAPGRAHAIGYTRFSTDDRGQYRGTFVRGGLEALEREFRKFLHDTRLQKLSEFLTDHIAHSMADTGYTGPVGVDMLVYRDADTLRLKPIVEINPRFTMGRVALHLANRVHPSRVAIWLILGGREIRAAGFPDIAAFATHLEDRHPPALSAGRLSRGALFTTDPFRARAFASLLLIGESRKEFLFDFGFLDSLSSL